MTIGNRIRNRRLELKMTQEDLAKKLGKTKSAICKVETDKEQNLTSDRVTEFAKALNCTPSYLMGWEEKETSVPTFKPEHIKLITLYEKLSDEKKEALFTLLETM